MPPRIYGALYLAFFLSGAAALFYQISWERLLALSIGGDVAAVALIVSAFMTGLGLGSWIGGKCADKISFRWNFLFFILAEVGVGAFGVFSGDLFSRQLPQVLGLASVSRTTETIILFLVLLAPTFLMGVSLPVLSRILGAGTPQVSFVIGKLYAWNTLGASVGAFVCTWMFLPLKGMEGAIHWAAGCNFLCAVVASIGAFFFLRNHQDRQVLTSHHANEAADAPRPHPSFRTCVFLFFICGFLAITAETAWLRFLGAAAKSSSHTFGTLLGTYLFGLGAGARAAVGWVCRSKNPWRDFLRFQAAAASYIGVGTAVVLWLFAHGTGLFDFKGYLDQYEPVTANLALQLLHDLWKGTLSSEHRALIWVYPLFHIVLPGLLILPATFLMGASFPFLQQVAQRDSLHVGGQTGLFQMANILGCILGGLGTTLVLFPLIGTSGVFRLLTLSGIGFWILNWGLPRRTRVILAVAVVLTALGIPNQADFWAACHGRTKEQIVFQEDASGLSLLKREADGKKTWVFVNGIGQSWIPYGGVHSLLGALPVLLHSNPESVALIGLGSGDTLFSMRVRNETKRIFCAEIVTAQRRTLERVQREPGMEALAATLEDPRVRFFEGDGRKMLSSVEKYDVIEADALRPDSAHAGALYSKEYFELAQARLKEGGMFVTWIPSQRVAETLVHVFPHVCIVGGMIGIGSSEKLNLQEISWRQRVQSTEVERHFLSAGVNILELVGAVFGPGQTVQQVGPEFDRSQLKLQLNTDLFPRDELSLQWP
jgi:predicted membrane-bound spermidine synthase